MQGSKNPAGGRKKVERGCHAREDFYRGKANQVFGMKLAQTALSTVAIFLLVASIAGVGYAATSGFAVYSVNFTYHGVSRSLTVNESITPTSNQAFDQLVLKVMSASWNFNYSRSINSTLALFPFLPAVSNQTFSFANGQSRVSLAVARNGTSILAFQGGTYKLSTYTLSVNYATTNSTGSITGAFHTLPSGLLYSLNGSIDGTSSIAVTLLSTSLPLNAAGSSSSALQAASAGIGAGAALSVVALSLGIRHKRQNSHSSDSKPDYWVD
jgi:hypothetical protein